MVNSMTYGILGVLIIITAGAGFYFLSPEQLDAASTCTSNNITAIFERLSSTNKTGYWTENSTTKQIICKNGTWIPTREWLLKNNLTEKDVIISNNQSNILFDEFGNFIITDDTIIADTTKDININGKIYHLIIEQQPILKCLCNKPEGCLITDCMKNVSN